MNAVFHRLIKQDLRTVLGYYESEVGPQLSARFYHEFEQVVAQIVQNPKRFHPISDNLRRANFPTFPYHLLYRETKTGVKILVLRHHRRTPNHGTGRS